jgi:hypothetical protein
MGSIRKSGVFVSIMAKARGIIAGAGDAHTVLGFWKVVWPHAVAGGLAVVTAVAGIVESIGLAWSIVAGLVALVLVEILVVLAAVARHWKRTRRPRIAQIPLKGTASLEARGERDAPYTYFARFIHLLNSGAATVLYDWEVVITPPGGLDYTMTLLEPERWSVMRQYVERHEHCGTPILRGATLDLRTQCPVEATVVGYVNGVSFDTFREGTNVRVSAKDGYGKSWQLYDAPMPVKRLPPADDTVGTKP